MWVVTHFGSWEKWESEHINPIVFTSRNNALIIARGKTFAFFSLHKFVFFWPQRKDIILLLLILYIKSLRIKSINIEKRINYKNWIKKINIITLSLYLDFIFAVYIFILYSFHFRLWVKRGMRWFYHGVCLVAYSSEPQST